MTGTNCIWNLNMEDWENTQSVEYPGIREHSLYFPLCKCSSWAWNYCTNFLSDSLTNNRQATAQPPLLYVNWTVSFGIFISLPIYHSVFLCFILFTIKWWPKILDLKHIKQKANLYKYGLVLLK